MVAKILFAFEVMALIAAPFGYLKLRDYRAEQFFEEGDAALQAGDWGRAYTCYQESARRENKELVKDVACRLTLCKDFGLGVAPAAQLQNCPWHDRMFSHCLAVCKVPAKQIFEGAKQGLAESGSTDLIVWVAAAYMNGYSTVPQPYEEAADWYRMAAVRGRVDAQRQLVAMAYERKWTPGSGELPSEWLLNVKDMLEARILLGERVAAGDKTLAEYSEADDWLLVATQYGNRAATERVIEKVLAGTYSSEKREEVLRLLLIAAHDGNVAAQVCIGLKLAEGEDFPLSQETAINYILAAARQGNEKAQKAIEEQKKKAEIAQKFRMVGITDYPDGTHKFAFLDETQGVANSFLLGIGECENGFTLIEADYDAEWATLTKDGLIFTLSFDKGLIDEPVTAEQHTELAE